MTTLYSTGTATVSNGSTTVTGTGTSWHTSGYRADDIFWAAGLTVRIASIDSATQITLARAWPGSSLSGADYELIPVFDDDRALTAANDLLQALGANGNLTSIGALASGANKAPYFTGAGTASMMDVTPFARTLLDDNSAATARATLGVNITQSKTDTTNDRLLKVGDFGLGTINPPVLDNVDATGTAAGFYTISSPAGTIPFGHGYMIVQRRGDNRLAQTFIPTQAPQRTFTRFFDGTAWSAWSLLYGQNSVLGAVAQSGGIPTGALIERGSNANGTYTRYADGTQTCWAVSPTLTTDTALGASGFFINSAGHAWTYPAAFSASPTVSVTARRVSGTHSHSGMLSSATLSAAGCTAFMQAYGNGLQGVLHMTAHGRWF